MPNSGPFALQSVIYGSFTAPRVEEAVASFEGCEPHTSLFGGSIILTKIGGAWSMVRYQSTLITNACVTCRLQSGRDLLLCEQEDGHMDGRSQGIALVDLTKQDYPDCVSNVFGVVDTSAACGPTSVRGTINSAALADSNGGDMPDLRLGITVSHATFPNEEGMCAGDAPELTVQKYKLDFLFQPDTLTFVPAPSSRATVGQLEALFKDAVQKARDITLRSLHH
jgi:hypothetical protein